MSQGKVLQPEEGGQLTATGKQDFDRLHRRKKELLFFDALWRNSAWIGVLGGSQNPSVTGALEPVQKPDSFGIAVKALAKSRVRSPELSR